MTIFALHLGLFIIALFNFGRAFFYVTEPVPVLLWLILTIIALVQCARRYRDYPR